MKCHEIEVLISAYLKKEEKEPSYLIQTHIAEYSNCLEIASTMQMIKNELGFMPEIKSSAGYLQNFS